MKWCVRFALLGILPGVLQLCVLPAVAQQPAPRLPAGAPAAQAVAPLPSAPVIAPDPFAAKGPTVLNGQVTGHVSLNAGDFQALMLAGRPDVYFVSGNGRFVIRGPIYDMWQGRELPGIDDIKAATETVNFPALAQLIPEFAPLRIGTGPRQVAVFVDPNCPYCQRLLNDIAARGDDGVHQFVILPVALLGPDSVREVRNLHCATDHDAALKALLTHDYAAPLAEAANCDIGAVQKRLIFARLLQIRGVPFLIRDDGVRQEGMPANLAVWLDGAHG